MLYDLIDMVLIDRLIGRSLSDWSPQICMDLHADCVAVVCNAGYTAGGDLVVCLEYALFAVTTALVAQ